MGRKPRGQGLRIPSPLHQDALVLGRRKAELGPEVDGLMEVMTHAPPVSLRVNHAKWTGPDTERVPWCTAGRYLAERPAFTFDPRLHAGHYYVQEASSMLLEQAMKAIGLHQGPIIALDLCAAPGGKSTHLRSLLHKDALLVSNEVDRKRRTVLQENTWKWGAANHLVTGATPAHFARLPEFFDLVIVDAPCSGEGMFRKDDHAREQWSPALVERCSALQQDIVQQAWSCLKPGGSLVYSTCTWGMLENEEQLARLVRQGAACVRIPIDAEWGVLRSERLGVDALRCYPHRLRGEGLFMGVVRKPGEHMPDSAVKDGPVQRGIPELAWLKNDRPWHVLEQDGVRFAVDGRWSRPIERIGAVLPMCSPGIPLAERKAEGWRPHEALALAQDLQHTDLRICELDLEASIRYLQGLSLPSSDARGIALARYGDAALGWLQGAGNRWNNRWPAGWRIRAHQPHATPVSWSRG